MKWTAADKKRARIEGWDISNGYPIRVFNTHSHSSFLSVYQIVAHISQCAESSEWHRDIFLSLPWTSADDIQARNDGWDLSRGIMNIRSFNALVFPQTSMHAITSLSKPPRTTHSASKHFEKSPYTVSTEINQWQQYASPIAFATM